MCIVVIDTATTEIYTLSLHDALPICFRGGFLRLPHDLRVAGHLEALRDPLEVALAPDVGEADRQDAHEHRRLAEGQGRSEEHTSELQSQSNLVCRLLLEKKKK